MGSKLFDGNAMSKLVAIISYVGIILICYACDRLMFLIKYAIYRTYNLVRHITLIQT